MPWMSTTLGYLNTQLGTEEHIDNVDAALYAPGAVMSQSTLNIVGDQRVGGTLNSVVSAVDATPPGISEAMRALIYQNLNRPLRALMTFGWAPGYDWELSVWESPGSAQTRPSITVLVKSRYPNDANPLSGARMDNGG